MIPLFALGVVAFVALLVLFGMAVYQDRPAMALIFLLAMWLALWCLLDLAGLRLVRHG